MTDHTADLVRTNNRRLVLVRVNICDRSNWASVRRVESRAPYCTRPTTDDREDVPTQSQDRSKPRPPLTRFQQQLFWHSEHSVPETPEQVNDARAKNHGITCLISLARVNELFENTSLTGANVNRQLFFHSSYRSNPYI